MLQQYTPLDIPSPKQSNFRIKTLSRFRESSDSSSNSLEVSRQRNYPESKFAEIVKLTTKNVEKAKIRIFTPVKSTIPGSKAPIYKRNISSESDGPVNRFSTPKPRPRLLKKDSDCSEVLARTFSGDWERLSLGIAAPKRETLLLGRLFQEAKEKEAMQGDDDSSTPTSNNDHQLDYVKVDISSPKNSTSTKRLFGRILKTSQDKRSTYHHDESPRSENSVKGYANIEAVFQQDQSEQEASTLDSSSFLLTKIEMKPKRESKFRPKSSRDILLPSIITSSPKSLFAPDSSEPLNFSAALTNKNEMPIKSRKYPLSNKSSRSSRINGKEMRFFSKL